MTTQIPGVDDWYAYAQNEFFGAGALSPTEFLARYAKLFAKRTLMIPRDRPLTAYWGASLFSAEHRAHNRLGKEKLGALPVKVFVPQEDGGLLLKMIERGMSEQEAKRRVFEKDAWAIAHSDLYIGARWSHRPDAGECWEHGCAWALGKPCLAIQWSEQRSYRYCDNPMLTASLTHEPFRSTDLLVEWLASEFATLD